MQTSLNCPHGHFWQIEPAGDGATHVCPSCGAAAVGPANQSATARPDPVSLVPHSPADPQDAATVAPPNASTTTAAPAVRPSVPGYELLAELGRGGMGVVYKARHLQLDRVVALKMILAGGHAGHADLERFRVEALAIARLQHANIVQIHEVGEQNGLPYFSLEYCAGGTLAQKLAGTPLSPKEAAAVVETLARAIHAAHQKGILHRDLKPANVLLAENGTPKITDFGLAKKLDEAGKTATGAVMGTPSYMAPEQAGGKGKELGPACDVYALGAILYECLTGRPPFRAATPLDTIMQVLGEEPAPPRQLQSKTPRDLETICLKCLEKDPSRRYGSAEALAEDLVRWQRQEPIRARPSRALERVWKWARRRPAGAALAAVSLVAVLSLLTFGLVFNWSLSVAYDEIKTQKHEVEVRGEQLQKERDKSQARLQKALLEQARAERGTGQRWRALELLAEAAHAEPTLELRQAAIETMITPGIREVCRLGPHSITTTNEEPLVAFSADNSLLATTESIVDPKGGDQRLLGVKVWEVPSGKPVAEAECNSWGGFTFSPRAPVLALAGKGMVRLWEPRTGKQLFEFPGEQPLRFRPDGNMLAVAGKDGVAVWDLRTRQKLPFAAPGTPVAFVSSNLMVRDGKRLRVWRCRDGVELAATPADWTPLVSDPGNIAGDVDYDQIVLWQKEGQAPSAPIALALWGRRRLPGLGTVMDFRRFTEVPHLNLPRLPEYAGALPSRLNAGLLAYQDPSSPQTIELVDIFTGKPRGRLVRPGFSSNAMVRGRFSPDGSILASQEAVDGKVRLWDVRAGRTIAYLNDHESPVWSPDGRYLALVGPGRFKFPNGGETSGPRIATVVHEVALPPPEYPGNEAIRALTIGAGGGQVAAQGAVWNVLPGPDSFRLLPLAAPKKLRATYYAGPGQLWTADVVFPVGEPTRTEKVAQVYPKNREIVLEGVGPKTPALLAGLAVSSDGKRMLIALRRPTPDPNNPKQWQWDMQFVLELWDLEAGKRLSTWAKQTQRDTNALQFTPDGRHAVFGGYVWDVATGKAVTFNYAGRQMVFRADGQVAFSAANEQGKLNRINMKKWLAGVVNEYSEAAWPSRQGDVEALVLNPDATILATGGSDRTICLWDEATQRELARWESHQAKVTAMAFLPDGRTLISGAADGTLRLWDLPTIRRELKQLGLDW